MRKEILKKIPLNNDWKEWWAWYPIVVYDIMENKKYWVWGETVYRKWFWSKDKNGVIHWNRELGPTGYHVYQFPEKFDCYYREPDKRAEDMKNMIEQAIEDMKVEYCGGRCDV